MKKNIVIALAAALLLALASFSYAKYVSGYKVVEVAEKEVTIQQGDDARIMVPVKQGRFRVGDEVLYDAEKQKVKKQLEGC